MRYFISVNFKLYSVKISDKFMFNLIEQIIFYRFLTVSLKFTKNYIL